MAKGTRALSGAAKAAYLRRSIRAEPDIPAPAGERLVERLAGEISTLTLKPAKPVDAPVAEVTLVDETLADRVGAEADAGPSRPTFDPYSPNVVVVFRTRGRDAALAELKRIGNADDLRLLAREQQLGIQSGLADTCDICQAIVAAAERRIANRRAAAR